MKDLPPVIMNKSTPRKALITEAHEAAWKQTKSLENKMLKLLTENMIIFFEFSHS